MCKLRDGINLAQGFSDDLPPGPLRESAIDAIRAGWNHYSSTWGFEDLRIALGVKLSSFNGIHADPVNEITVTCGATEGIACSILALVDRGDEVIMFEPFYENYAPNVILADGIPKFIRLRRTNEIPEESLKEAIGSRTKAIILNTPQNPIGKVYRKEELRFLADVCVDYGLVAICDETYERFTYDGLPHISLASLSDMAQQTLTVGTFSKTFSVTGWRVGYVAGPEHLTESVRQVHDFVTVAAPTPFQRALVDSVDVGPSFYERLIQSFQTRRGILCEGLRELGFQVRVPEGAYYVMADFSDLSSLSDRDFAFQLLDESGVATVPGSAFYGSRRNIGRQIRLSFCKSDVLLQHCVKVIQSFVENLNKRGKELREKVKWTKD